MTTLVIDQRFIQKRGNICAKAPTSCLIKDMIKNIGLKPNKLKVLDITYGVGKFYKAWKPKRLVGIDPMKWNWETIPDQFYQIKVQEAYKYVKNQIFDLLVIDPPWSRYKHSKRKHYSFKVGSPEEILDSGFELGYKMKIPYVLVHHGELIVPNTYEPLLVVKYIYVSRRLKNNLKRKPKYSYFYILKLKNK